MYPGPAARFSEKLPTSTLTLPSLGSSDCTSIEAMNGGICVCVLLAALSSSCLGRPHPAPFQEEGRPAPPQLDSGLSERPATPDPPPSPAR
ncbi:hypothetical protein ANANG_G00177290 [Anguilla anguilla]|uniref:Gastrin/cholecystokinin peptide hormone domain-containing protein n=1 Tax=Anguilla anguilla TaxID=7936 RepID=A0A9D3M7U7_ANGAN|nr:hypothetical protein ANANG_G00177290 [Anguilla anguilla]